MNKKIALRLVGACCLMTFGAGANASIVPTFQGSSAAAAGGFTFNYDAQLTTDQGLSTSAPSDNASYGSRFVIYDFAGYIAGSAFSTNNLFTAAAELVSTGLTKVPGEIDDSSLYNLVFTYTGADFRTIGGPYESFDLGTFGARSTFSNTVMSSFSGVGVKNTGVPVADGGTAGTAAFNQGSVLAPVAPIPEASTWAMLLIGFGGIGSTIRRRKRDAAKASLQLRAI